jgi:hypothetical protein
MRRRLLTLAFLIAPAAIARAQPAGTSFTYQGHLTDNGLPGDGPFDFSFTLFDAGTGGSQVGPTVTQDDVAVADGLFTVSLDFGAGAFAGGARFLEVAVRPGASTGSYTTLGSRQELMPAPHSVFSQVSRDALFAPWTGVTGKPAGFADDIDNDSGGDITDVLAGTGLTGGGTTGAVTLDVALSGSGTATTVSRSDHEHLGQTWTGVQPLALGLRVTVPGTAGIGIQAESTSPGGATAGVVGLTSGTGGRGVIGRSTALGGAPSGVLGEALAATGQGVTGLALATTGLSAGVFGRSDSLAGSGVHGVATATTGATAGVRGETASSVGRGVYGVATATTGGPQAIRGDVVTGTALFGVASATSGAARGVMGQTASTGAQGVMGIATASTGIATGVGGSSSASVGYGVSGFALATTGPASGVRGDTTSSTGAGILGFSATTGASSAGVRGVATAPGLAGHFIGDVTVEGTLSKGAGSFKIDHPLDPENRYLYHSFVESPDMKNVYDGVAVLDARGEAVVELPDWFEALNRDFRYQLTAIGAPGPGLHVAQKVREHRFVIAGGAPGQEVSWQVTGIRQDPYAEKHRIPVEAPKPEDERGKYLHPGAWEVPEERGLGHELRRRLREDHERWRAEFEELSKPAQRAP